MNNKTSIKQKAESAAAEKPAPRTFVQCQRCGATATLTTAQSQIDWLQIHECPDDESDRKKFPWPIAKSEGSAQ